MAMHPGATSGPPPARLVALLLLCGLQHVGMTAAHPPLPPPTNTSASVASQFAATLKAIFSRASLISVLKARLGLWEMVALTAACGLLAACRLVPQRWSETAESEKPFVKRSETKNPDPGLLKKHSTVETYETSVASYPAIRTFFHPHPHGEKLPKKPKPLPLLVFIHGLGGSLAQFNNLLTSLVNVGPCFGIDLPGCGRSHFKPHAWEAYSHSALVELVEVAISRGRDRAGTQEVILICHSMGCSIAASLQTNATGMTPKSKQTVVGIIAICPKVSLPSLEQAKGFDKLLRVPTPIFDLWRAWDRRGGVDSASVSRFVGPNSSTETKRLQLRFNEQSKTAVWRRMARGAAPRVNDDMSLSGGLPGPQTWSKISVPLFVVAGAADQVTKPEEAAVITAALGRDASPAASPSGSPTVTNAGDRDAHSPANYLARDAEKPLSAPEEMNAPLIEKNYRHEDDQVSASLAPRRAVLKTTILPSPAAHGLLYDAATYRTLSGVIQTFMAGHIDARLSLGWQLQHLKEANKWDVKNLAKWQAVPPVSDPIAGIFVAMKTLRERDDVHSPAQFVANWAGRVRAVVDISHENPVYSPEALEAGGIEYRKFPTVSKIPPTEEECREFIALIDAMRADERRQGGERLIAVHCHYGFNRTGFFLCSYLIERERFGVQQAIDEFKRRRPPGIRHPHFLDSLFVRYCVGLKRAPTL